MSVLWPTNIFYKIPQLLTERCEDFIFVFYRVCATVSLKRSSHSKSRSTVEEWYELVSCALRT